MTTAIELTSWVTRAMGSPCVWPGDRHVLPARPEQSPCLVWMDDGQVKSHTDAGRATHANEASLRSALEAHGYTLLALP